MSREELERRLGNKKDRLRLRSERIPELAQCFPMVKMQYIISVILETRGKLYFISRITNEDRMFVRTPLNASIAPFRILVHNQMRSTAGNEKLISQLENSDFSPRLKRKLGLGS